MAFGLSRTRPWSPEMEWLEGSMRQSPNVMGVVIASASIVEIPVLHQ